MTEMTLLDTLIVPDWPAPKQVKCIQTTRVGGFSAAPYDSLNLGDHVNDAALNVAKNRQLLSAVLPSEPVWLQQLHGTRVIDAAKSACLEQADAAFTNQINTVCVTMTADCLPILLCDTAGTCVAAIHAGWRGLCDGVIEATIKTMPAEPKQLMAWLGPAIGAQDFIVGDAVRTQFLEKDTSAKRAFVQQGEKWLCDLYLLARQRLQQLAVNQIYGGDLCTYSDKTRFFSYRRDGETGRMASLIWLTA